MKLRLQHCLQYNLLNTGLNVNTSNQTNSLKTSTKGLTEYVYSRRRMLRLHMGKSTAS